MALRKITTDKSVKYIPKGEKTKERNIKAGTINKISKIGKQNKNFHKIIKKFLIIFQHQDSNSLNE